MMMVRKVIQISNSVAQETDDYSEYQIIVALCDDGTMWSIRGRAWQQLPPIPQPEIADCDITFEWQQLPPNHTAINRGDDVVMAKVGDEIIGGYDIKSINPWKFNGKFDAVTENGLMRITRDGSVTHVDRWKFNESDPWRDASGKIVEV